MTNNIPYLRKKYLEIFKISRITLKYLKYLFIYPILKYDSDFIKQNYKINIKIQIKILLCSIQLKIGVLKIVLLRLWIKTRRIIFSSIFIQKTWFLLLSYELTVFIKTMSYSSYKYAIQTQKMYKMALISYLSKFL